MTAIETAGLRLGRTPVTGAAARTYWDVKAQTYPRPDDPAVQAKAERLRQLAVGCGVSFAVERVLDLGAGTGVHALALARQAQQVVALDLSADMLAPLRALKLPNVECRSEDWAGVDLGPRGWCRGFDLVWAAMTPLAGDAALLAKLEAASRGLCCAITWGRERSDPVIEQAFALHGVEFRAPAWIEVLDDYLVGRGARCARLREDNRREVPVSTLVDDLAAHLGWLGIDPDRQRLAAWASSIANRGVVRRDWSATLECRVWNAH